MTAKADTNPLREALQATLCELTACASQLAARGLPGHPDDSVSRAQKLARAALASEPVAGTEREALAGALAEHDHKRTQQVMLTEPSWVGQARRALSAPPAPAAEDIGREAEELIANSRPAPAGREGIARAIATQLGENYDLLVDLHLNAGFCQDDFLRAADAALALGATVSPHGLCPTAETISACARSTLIGFRGELGDGNIAFICDQISRKSVLDCIPPAPGAADRAEWQDISTAPRDGSEILVVWGDVRVITYWAERVGFKGWQPPAMMTIKVYDRASWNPKLWMPLPSLPRADRGGAAE